MKYALRARIKNKARRTLFKGAGLDPQVNYAVRADGTYTVRVFAFPATPDSSIRHFGSDLSVYRLTITTGPFVDYATPLAVREGADTDFTLYGWNLKEKTTREAPLITRREPHDCFDLTAVKPTEPLTPPFSLTDELFCTNETTGWASSLGMSA